MLGLRVVNLRLLLLMSIDNFGYTKVDGIHNIHQCRYFSLSPLNSLLSLSLQFIYSSLVIPLFQRQSVQYKALVD